MKKVKCPVCSKRAEKHGSWKMKDGSRNRLYVHETNLTQFEFQEVTKSCIANEPPNTARTRLGAGVSRGDNNQDVAPSG